jgi:hypothetical protein
MERYTFFWGKMPPLPPQKKPASAAKPILVCLYKTLTLMLYNLINLPNLMGARRSCGQFLWRTGGKIDIKSTCVHVIPMKHVEMSMENN